MTKGEDFIKKRRCKNKHCAAMSSAARCDLIGKGKILKLFDECPNPKCNWQKIKTLTPNQYMLEGGSINSKLQKTFRGTETAWDKFIKPGLKIASPIISAAVAAKTKNPQSAQITSNILKTLPSGKILSLTDMHGNGLWLKVM